MEGRKNRLKGTGKEGLQEEMENMRMEKRKNNK